MARARFRYMPHTADIAFVAYGKSFRETLENAALALLGVMFDIPKIRRSKGKARTLRITESASDEDDLLWFALQKIVSKVDEKGVSAFGFKVNSITKRGKRAVLHGCVYYKHVSGYAALLDVKAVTPHELRVSRTQRGYSARVLLDV